MVTLWADREPEEFGDSLSIAPPNGSIGRDQPQYADDMTDAERLESFAIMSGLAPQSVDAIRPDFPRWVRYMRERGVTEIPDSPLTGNAHAVNMASMLIRQKAGA